MIDDERSYLVAGPESTTVVGTGDLARRLADADQAGVCLAFRQIDPTNQPTDPATSDTNDRRRPDVRRMTDGSDRDAATTWNVAPDQSQWYWCAVVDDGGETNYIDGYANGSNEPLLSDAPISDSVTVLEWTVQMTPGNRDYISPTHADDPADDLHNASRSDADDVTDGM